MTDKYYVYRPLLIMLGFTEGTDKGDGYNETLAYGAFTGGNVNLVGMTLNQVDVLQKKMLAHPANNWNSSAVGRYQIVRKTLLSIRKALKLDGTELFNEELQDRCACFLLGQRGIDEYLQGKKPEDEMIVELSKEWASLPKLDGRSYYSNQHAKVSVNYVKDVLAEVKKRYGEPPVEVNSKFAMYVLVIISILMAILTGIGALLQ